MPQAKAPSMQRSRSQLATAYAPHSLFMFEGGEGACMALPDDNCRVADELGSITERTISEQIQEYFDAWAQRATRGNNLKHPVPLNLAIDDKAIAEGGTVRVRRGSLTFRVPETVSYVPFPLAFVCTKCKFYRASKSIERFASDAAQFTKACPTGSAGCANDWEQIDVVLAHWSGSVEPITPSHRRWHDGAIVDIEKCTSCESDRFYLERPPGALGRWHFRCEVCKTVRDILQRDRETLQHLGPMLGQNLALPAEINMEPVSCRASAVYYPHGDRLLVFKEDSYISLLLQARSRELEGFICSEFGYPTAQMPEEERERLLRAAGRGQEWDSYVGASRTVATLEQANADPGLIEPVRQILRGLEEGWNATVLAGQQKASPGIADAVRMRQQYVRRFDPIRMAVEHKTLAVEKLHGGEMNDGRAISVDVSMLDEFLTPDGLSEEAVGRLRSEVRRRLGLLGVAEMRLLRDARVCEYTFAYSRTSSQPVVRREKSGDADLPVKLRLFDSVKEGDGSMTPVLCLVQSNEGLYVRLDEPTVMHWLTANSIRPLPATDGVRLGGRLIEEFAQLEADDDSKFSRFLDEYRREKSQDRRAFPFVYTLLHTMAHHLIDVAASMSGLDKGSFGEHIFAPDLSFLVYRRGMTMDLGNLSSMWRDRGDPSCGNEVLDRMVNPASLRCGSESVCNHRGGACPDCILLPESNCITRNELLSRSVLIGRGSPRWGRDGRNLVGFYEVAARRATRGA